MKTGGMGGTWVPLAPPELSQRCQYWLRQIERGWRPNHSWRMQGYDNSAGLYGVYLWEYLNVIAPRRRTRS